MKSPEYNTVVKLLEEHSSFSYFPLDNLLNKLDNQNLVDLNEILEDVYEAGKVEGRDEGYNDGYDDGKSNGYREGWDAAELRFNP
jgi:flagellar biosynthesis/type III secretory pathway protein FliH